jgi:hypothetical protein
MAGGTWPLMMRQSIVRVVIAGMLLALACARESPPDAADTATGPDTARVVEPPQLPARDSAAKAPTPSQAPQPDSAGAARPPQEKLPVAQTQSDTTQRARDYAPIVRGAVDRARVVTLRRLAGARGDDSVRDPREADRYDPNQVRLAFQAGHDTLENAIPVELRGFRDAAGEANRKAAAAIDSLPSDCPGGRCSIGAKVRGLWQRFELLTDGMKDNAADLYVTLFVSSGPAGADAMIASYAGQKLHQSPTSTSFRTWRAEFQYEVRFGDRTMKGNMDLVTQPLHSLHCDFLARPVQTSCRLGKAPLLSP